MPNKNRSERRSGRAPERIAFARDQRRRANEFAHAVWQMVRSSRIRGQKFRREHPIGPYTADFVCLGLKLIVEVDGKDHSTDEGQHRDEQRDRYFHGLGFKVVRFRGFEVTQDAASVLNRIEAAVDERIADAPSPPAPLPRKNRGRGELGWFGGRPRLLATRILDA